MKKENLKETQFKEVVEKLIPETEERAVIVIISDDEACMARLEGKYDNVIKALVSCMESDPIFACLMKKAVMHSALSKILGHQ